MSDAVIAAIVLAVIATPSAWRAWRRVHRHRGLLVIGQFVLAGALFVMWWAPDAETSRERWVVLTARVEAKDFARIGAHDRVIMLPEFDGALPDARSSDLDPTQVARVPDLATAKRRLPAPTAVRVLGAGLTARDREVATDMTVQFDAPPPVTGIVELIAPEPTLAGREFTVRGRVQGGRDQTLELRDPADVVASRTKLDDSGEFILTGTAKAPGRVLFELQRRDGEDKVLERLPVPVVVEPGVAIKIALLAGGPQPEQKYLRRWAADAGIDLRASIALSDRVDLLQGQARLDAESLRQLDLLMIDERAWSRLAPAQKIEIERAVRDGLGLLLRATGPLPSRVATDWAAYGFKVESADLSQGISLATDAGETASETTFTRRPIAVTANESISLLRASDDRDLAVWRPHGLGRVGLWWLDDSYRLVLDGQAPRFGGLWSRATQTLARARGPASAITPTLARVNERAVLCGLAPDARITEPALDAQPLSVENLSKDEACAAFWPRNSGWHAIDSANTTVPFYVYAKDEAPALFATTDARKTRELTSTSEAPSTDASRNPHDWRLFAFLAWLLLSALLWWLERRPLPTSTAN